MASSQYLRTGVCWPGHVRGDRLPVGDSLMLHCYRCNKTGVPIKDALCGECRATRKKWSLVNWATKIIGCSVIGRPVLVYTPLQNLPNPPN
jgi:hypothetical protein